MPAPRTTSPLSIKPAFVKAGEVVVPVMTAVGEWAEIAATPARVLAPLGRQGLPKTPASTRP